MASLCPAQRSGVRPTSVYSALGRSEYEYPFDFPRDSMNERILIRASTIVVGEVGFEPTAKSLRGMRPDRAAGDSLWDAAKGAVRRIGGRERCSLLVVCAEL